jgi:hypothetical protein
MEIKECGVMSLIVTLSIRITGQWRQIVRISVQDKGARINTVSVVTISSSGLSTLVAFVTILRTESVV